MNWQHLRRTALLAGLGVLGLVSVSAAAAQDFSYDVEIPEAGEALALGESVSGELSEDTPIVAYSVDLTTADTVGFTVNFDGFDGYLLLADESGDVVAYNDDAGGTDTSAISAFVPEEDGTYSVVVSSYSYVTSEGDDTSSEGEFELTASTLELTPIAVGDEVEGETSEDAPAALYSIDIAEGQILSITLESDDFDAEVFVTPVDSDDQDELSNDNYGDGANAQVGPYLFFEDGTYIIRAESVLGDEYGDYTLRVTEFEPEPIAIGDTARGELAPGNLYAFFAFEATDGQEVDITVTALENTDFAFVVYGPDNLPFAGNDDAESSDPALTDLELEDDGTYIVLVYPAGFFLELSDLGEFDISITES